MTARDTAATVNNEVNGRDFYDQIYQRDLEQEAEWSRLTALQKVRSVATLMRRAGFSPQSLLEVGCGTGAVIRECKRLALAETFSAIDYSTTALHYLSAADPAIRTLRADITSEDFRWDKPVDGIICSHVIEHLEEPRTFLSALRSRIDFKFAVFEVPLENLVGHKWRWRGRDRKANSAGHVQFFTSQSFEALLLRNGYRILARRRYVPRLSLETIRFVTDRQHLTMGGQLRKVVTNNVLPRLTAPVWSRLYYGHYATLCTKAGV